MDKITGKEPVHWMEPEDSIDRMHTIDAIYDKSGLSRRPSNYCLRNEEWIGVRGQKNHADHLPWSAIGTVVSTHGRHTTLLFNSRGV